MNDNFNERLKSGEKLWGTMVTLSDPVVCDALSRTGLDWLFVDGEHGPLETADLQRMMLAVSDRLAVLVRVPSIDETPIKKALDLGAQGIIVPQVNTVEQVRKVVEFSRYPPLGRRGIGLGRAQGYGQDFEDYVSNANSRVTVVIQAEHIEAVENIEDIVREEGIDAVLVGPYDLSASLDLTGDVGHPQVVAAIEQVASACQSQNIPLGIFGVNANAVAPYVAKGFNLVVAGIDVAMLMQATQSLLSDFRELE